MDSIKEFNNWRPTTIVVIIIGVKGVRDSKGEKQLLIVDGKGELTKTFLLLVTILEQNMNNFLRCIMEAIVEWF